MQLTGFMLTPDKIKPDFQKLDPMKGLGRIFGMQGMIQFAKSVVKIGVTGMIAWILDRAGRAPTVVNGAVMKNFPADVMRSFQLGPIVGVDVTRGRSITSDDVVRPPSIWSWILSGEWRKGPPIVALLMRAATVTTGRDLAAAREATDVLITPKLEGIDIRDWRAFEPAVKAGHIAASFALEALHCAVTDLRRRPSLAEKRASLSARR